MTDSRDDVSDRLASRFDDDDDSDSPDEAGDDQHNRSAENPNSAMNVKKAWNAKSFYLPDDLENELTKTYKRLDLELDDDLDNLKKTRHFYPLVVQAGLERIEELERNELLERIENTDQ